MRKISIYATSVRREMCMAFGLVLIAFLVFIGYLFPGASIFFRERSSLAAIVVILTFLILISFLIIARIIQSIVGVARQARQFASGKLNREISLQRSDEIGALGSSLNQMSRKIKDNLEQLKIFSEKTEEINLEINKRILVLSHLARLGEMITHNEPLDAIIGEALKKCSSLEDFSAGCLILLDQASDMFFMKAVWPQNRLSIKENSPLDREAIQAIWNQLLSERRPIVIDRNFVHQKEREAFASYAGISNAILAPVVIRKKVFGCLLCGNQRGDFVFSGIYAECADLIAKQIAIAYENNHLSQKLDQLEMTDQLTGLFNEHYIEWSLNEEIQRSMQFQRACGFVLISLDGFERYVQTFGQLAAENTLINIGNILKANLRSVDKAARIGDHSFGLILPERNKKKSIETADQIRKNIIFAFQDEEDQDKHLTCSAAVTENPLDGESAEELFTKATKLMEVARQKGGNKVCHHA